MLDTRSSLAYGKTANVPSRPVPHIHPGDTGFSAAIQPWQRPPSSGGGLFTQCSLSQYPVSLVLLFPDGRSLFPIRGVPTSREVTEQVFACPCSWGVRVESGQLGTFRNVPFFLSGVQTVGQQPTSDQPFQGRGVSVNRLPRGQGKEGDARGSLGARAENNVKLRGEAE